LDRGAEIVGQRPILILDVVVVEGRFPLDVLIDVIVELALSPTFQAFQSDKGMFVRNGFMPKPVDHRDAVRRLKRKEQAEGVVMVTSGTPMEHTGRQPARKIIPRHDGIHLGPHVVGVGLPEKPGRVIVRKPASGDAVFDAVLPLQGMGELVTGDHPILDRTWVDPHGADGVVIGAAEGPTGRLARHAPGVVHHDDALVLA
jgi:hypothetical protein